MRLGFKHTVMAGLCSAFCLAAPHASAALVFTFAQSGADTMVSYSGSLNFTGMSYSNNPVGTDTGTTIFSDPGIVGIRWNTGILVRGYHNPWSSAADFTISSTAINSGTALTQQLSIFDSVVYLNPVDFVGDVWSGSGSTTFAGTSVASIVNLSTPVVWTLRGPSADTVTWGLAPTSVPEPTTLLLAGLGLGLATVVGRKRRAS